jgi:hypothetical protein
MPGSSTIPATRAIVAAIVIAIGGFAAWRCGNAPGPAPAVSEWTLKLEALASPAGAASAQPQLTASPQDGVVLTWLEHADTTTTFRLSERTDTGWSEPRTIAAGRDFYTNWADVPSAIRLSDRTLVAHWLQRNADDSSGYSVKLARSRDEGRTWSAPFSPHHDGTPMQHGFASLFDLGGGSFGVAWLDGRAMKPSPDGEGVGDMSLRAAAFGADLAQQIDQPLDLRVCECCPTAAAVSAEGVLVAYRDRSAEDIRNIHVVGFAAGHWSDPAPVHDDGWRIDGCPVNGPAIVAAGRRAALAWFSVQKDRGHAFVAFSDDGGRTFGTPIRVDDTASLGRVDVELLDDGSAVVGWIELADQHAAFSVRRVERSGRRSAAVTVTDLGAHRNSGYPRMARRGGELVFAWAGTGDSLRVETAAARLP